ncbi:SRPBCC family protein [Streptomyces sp. AK02-01A]|uniref:SRPBCC family protein n=1 Tax=Streptomyces sp. AK02-01A TaxID=3028648 RepID=UPI0029BE5060|nr:SRPBCC family protein [Streptomyces sp. AK02-01A]MDX3853212.1 SRPBCC family protein [Streptomyces sp. AK02-01A]
MTTTPASAATSVSLEIPATADKVWQLIGGFGALPDWLPFITSSVLSEGGRLRTLATADDEVVVERLEAFDNAGRTYSYSIEQAPFPVTAYLSTIKVSDAAGEGAAVVEWSGTFTPAGVSEDEAIALFHGVYSDGLAALKEAFDG